MKLADSLVEVGDRALRLQAESMPNGELRVRLLDAAGVGYIQTRASKTGGWQNSHFHRRLLETYVVADGEVVVAELDAGGGLRLRRLAPGQVWTATPGQPHNVYMGPEAVTHVVKHGTAGEADWCTDARTERLDVLSKAVGPLELGRVRGG